jgi:hypothetical protein
MMVRNGQSNANGKCANFRCDFRRRGIFPKATYYDTKEKNWVCQCCAQSINREALAKSREWGIPYTQRCITGEDALFLTLKTGSLAA